MVVERSMLKSLIENAIFREKTVVYPVSFRVN